MILWPFFLSFSVVPRCFTVVLAARPGFDLNLPAEQSLDEHEVPSYTSQTSPGKRTYDQVQPPSHNSPAGWDFSSSLQVGQSNSGKLGCIESIMLEKDQVTEASAYDHYPSTQSSQTLTGLTESASEAKPGEFDPGRGPAPGRQSGADTSRTSLPSIFRSPDLRHGNLKESGHEYFMSQGRVVEKVLVKFVTRFENAIRPDDFFPRPSDRPSIEAHFNLLSGLAGGKTRRRLVSLYSSLLASIYNLHGEFLNQLDITTYNYRVQQEKVLEWLHQAIVDPNAGLPSAGIVNLQPGSARDLPVDHRMNIDPIKEMFIQYFSQQRNNPVRQSSAAYFLESYRNQHPTDYSDLIQSSNRPHEELLERNPHFQARLKFLSNVAGQSEHYCAFLKSKRKAESYSGQVGSFRKQFNGGDIVPAYLRSYHPRLRIATFFCEKDLGDQYFRIIRPQNGAVVQLRDLLTKLRILLKSVDYLDFLMLQNLQIDKTKFPEHRNSLLDWILRLIIKPKVGFPLIGTFKFPHDVAPWFDKDYESSILFGELQVKLLGYFSGDMSNDNLENISVFLLAAWYHDVTPHKNGSRSLDFPQP
ncbi:hypothetical protein PSTG_00782 [Puccinia striiformis f. sp. tritici PST-78]|uniref:HECT domain-containing protein n=1 Tax=Puccinia striiformis f. sp. tritici PST-78 TaxID=1165861 RepID=A0A0L0W4P9_9BASI|nr:hypothetical protein PSTG_00782 [Puccinia striiformis f. sp. tritici PST-78]